MKNTFGSYIRTCRIKAGIGQREFARKIGVSPSYLNDIEHSKRPSPSANFLNKMQYLLPIDVEKLNDLAGKTRDRIPPDVEHYLLSNTESISLMRILQNLKFTDEKILELKNMVASQNYKAIIIAAGLGSRLEELTKDIPKCMLELNGKSILQHQIDSYQANGISDISVVRGYKKEKINPLGGCLPILIQIPFFIALYWVLLASVELRDAPFIFWITDLSAKDPFYVLPILMALSMVAQSWLSPTPPDPIQAKVMKIMPVVFSVFFFFFASGLVLYWLVNNVLSIAQQWTITRAIEGKKPNNAKQ